MRDERVGSTGASHVAHVLVVLIAAAVLTVAFAGCASPPNPAPAGVPATGSAGVPITSSGGGSYTAHADSSVEATGYVAHSDLEGGFWALYDRPVGPSSHIKSKVLAVLLPDRVDEPGIAALDGAYVTLVGRLAQSASVRMAGPEVFVLAIVPVTSDAPR